jgi:Flp pilus assembly protein protease CpaA
LKNIGSINQWNTELRILFYTCLIGINLIVLFLTFASKKDMNEILQYNLQGMAEKSKNRKFVKWYRNTVKNEKQKWKFVLIIVITAVGEVLLLFLNRIMK